MQKNKIRQTRVDRGISQKELARKSGVSVRNIQYLEKGMNDNPNWITINLLAQALGVPVSELMEEENVECK